MATANLDSADLKAVAEGGLINEDVMQQIWDISDIPLPFTDSISSDTVSNSFTEYTQDKLDAPDLTNARVDGADAGTDDSSTGSRVGSHCQISDKVVKVSNRAGASDTIGFADALAYQVMKQQKNLRRDVEAISLTQQASVADDGDSVAGLSAGFYAWLTTNTDRGATGADGGFSTGVTDAPTPGTPRALDETSVRDLAQSVWEEGGNPEIMTSTPTVIRRFSEYMFTSDARIATLTSDVRERESATVATGSVNIFITDFGVTLSMIPNRLHPIVDAGLPINVNLALYDPEYVRQGFLQGYMVEPLAKTGTANNRQMSVDWTLKVLNEAAHGVFADIDSALPVLAVPA